MEDFLIAVKTTKVKVVDEEIETLPSQQSPSISADTVSSPHQVLTILREQPGPEALRNALIYLDESTKNSAGFNIKVPGPLSAQIISTLVNDVVADYWDAWGAIPKPGTDKVFFLRCLTSVTGLGAIVARLKSLAIESQQQQRQITKSQSAQQQTRIILEVLSQLLSDRFVWDILVDINKLIPNPTQRQLLWREFISFTASGRTTSAAAQADDVLKEYPKDSHLKVTDKGTSCFWMADGSKFAKWLGRSVATVTGRKGLSTETELPDAIPAVALLLGRAFGLGYTEDIVSEIVLAFLTQKPEEIPLLQSLLQNLRAHEQRQFLFYSLNAISKKYLDVNQALDTDLEETPKAIAGSAALLLAIASSSEALKDGLVTWLTSTPSVSGSGSFAIRRVAILALQGDEDRTLKVMERSMDQFGDELFIKHTPIVQQEALAQVMLMSCGYVHRSQPMFLFALARSSVHMKGTSNRLGTSSTRARLLGMVAATAISELVDKPESRLKFEINGDDFPEAEWYRRLVYINDEVGSLNDLEPVYEPSTGTRLPRPDWPEARNRNVRSKKQGKEKGERGPRVVEILDDSDDGDDLVPYAKPDSDPEDESEDPTLIQRNKPSAPVYIRDLLSGLREDSDLERHHLALSTAASLIRRKTDFGKEVKDNIEELAAVLIGLNDQFELESFQEMRQQALIAILLAQPMQMGPLFVRSFYGGDYSFSQRVAILTALGLGAREMAGFKDETSDAPGPSGASGMNQFPSKMLPDKLHKIYSEEKAPIDALTDRLKHTMISPLALDAADKLSGPNALKVRTFSSRMEVEKRRKVITNELAKIVARSFFFPLTGGWWAHAKAHGSGNIYYSPHLLPVFAKTLAILLHASGPSTLSLPQMTAEFWDLLLSVRTLAFNDIAVMEAVLFAFLTLLDVNEDKQRVVQEHARELLETHEWVKIVFDRMAGGDEEGERVRSLAAGVLVRCSEVVEKHQRLLMGDMMEF